MNAKKGVSDVVITVSLVLISIVAVGVISAFVIPMLKTQLGKSSACLNLREHFQVRTDVSATCYNDSEVRLTIQRGSQKEDSKGFAVTVFLVSGEANAYQVLNDSTDGLPTKGSAKLYKFATGANVERVTLATILPTDDQCDPIDYTSIRKC